MFHQLRRIAVVVTVALSVGPLRTELTPEAAYASEEGGVTCAWCGWVNFGNGPFHLFFTGTDLCGAPKPGPMEYSTVECSRCGGTSSCHTAPEDGECHLACGGENLRKLEAELAQAIDGGRPEQVIRILQSEHAGVSTVFSLEGGRINLIADCDPKTVAASIAISPALNVALASRLSE